MIAALADRDPSAFLSVMAGHLHASVGVLWEIDADVLKPRTIWVGSGVEGDLVDDTRRTQFRIGEGKPGQVWRTGSAFWEARFATNAQFMRAPAAHDAGLRSGLWFPIKAFDQLLGVVELLRSEEADPDAELLECLRLIGHVLGLYLHTTQTQSAALAGERALRADLEREVAVRQQQVHALDVRLKRLHDSGVFGMGVGTFDGRMLEANDQFLDMLGYTQADLATLRLDDITAPESKDADDIARVQLVERGVALPYEKEFIRRDGSRVPVILGAALLDRESAICVVVDISARKAAERELALANVRTIEAQATQIAASEELLRALTQRLMRLREETGTTIAREIHDVLGTELTGLKMDTAWVLRQLGQRGDAPGEVERRLREVLSSIDRLVVTIRKIATDLRPQILDDLGLAAALRWYARTFAERSGLIVELDVPIEVAVEPERSTAMFRIAQELMTNVVRHASATSIAIALEQHDDALELRVRDDGVGMPPHAVDSTASLGLLGVRERALAFGAR